MYRPLLGDYIQSRGNALRRQGCETAHWSLITSFESTWATPRYYNVRNSCPSLSPFYGRLQYFPQYPKQTQPGAYLANFAIKCMHRRPSKFLFGQLPSVDNAHCIIDSARHAPGRAFALGSAESTTKVGNLGKSCSMCSKHCDTFFLHGISASEGCERMRRAALVQGRGSTLR